MNRSFDKTLRTCELYSHAVNGGEDASEVVGHLARLDGVNRPAIWRRLRSGGVLPPYNSHRTARSPSYAEKVQRGIQQAAASHQRREQEAAMPRVSRDPCPRCGVRRDIGCGHSLAPLGMTL